jgi:drug/metabolite transporter (DMT)-like permease
VNVARLQLLLAAVLFSTGGAVVKATAFTNWQVAGFRSAIAGVVLYLASREARRFSWRTWLVGLAYGTTLVTFVTANKLTTAANAVFLQAAAPLYLLLAGPWLLREPVRRRDFAFIVPIALGLVLLFSSAESASATAPNRPLGNLIGAFSGMAWSLTIAGLRWLGRSKDPRASAAAATVCGNVLAAAASLPFALPVVGAHATDWLAVGYLGCFQVGLAYVLVARAIGHVPAMEASLLLLAEPALSPFWAWWMHGEAPGLLAVLGGLLIIATTTIGAMTKKDAT